MRKNLLCPQPYDFTGQLLVPVAAEDGATVDAEETGNVRHHQSGDHPDQGRHALARSQILQPAARTEPELLKRKISVAEQAVSLRLRQLASTTDDYEEQISLAAALKSLEVLKKR